MLTNPFNYYGTVEHHGHFSGADIGNFVRKMKMVTLAKAGISLSTSVDAGIFYEKKRLISGQEAYDFLVEYFSKNKYTGQYKDFDRLQFNTGAVSNKDGLRRLVAISGHKNFPDTKVYMATVTVTEQPLLLDRIKMDLKLERRVR